MKAVGKQVYIRLLTPEDVTDAYVNWMNDPEVTQYLESKWQTHTHKSSLEYIDSLIRDRNNYLFGVFLLSDNTHIGNVKIGNIHPIHRYCDIGLAIGKKDNWTKGVGSEVLMLIEKIAFKDLNLNKIWGGIYANNFGSFKMTQKCGWREVGRFEKHVFFNGEYIDVIIVEKLIERK
ncbi:MAG: GNAT family N-acetyltransferase [Bacteroidales bacterium]|nr:GNAT family N-acetyltransferase [Bacteroidales bacterium]